EIRLAFDNSNRLKVIWFTTTKFQQGYNDDGVYSQWNFTKDFNKIREKLVALFGAFESCDIDRENQEWMQCVWTGQKVLLSLKYEYYGVENGDRGVIMLVAVNPEDFESGF